MAGHALPGVPGGGLMTTGMVGVNNLQCKEDRERTI